MRSKLAFGAIATLISLAFLALAIEGFTRHWIPLLYLAIQCWRNG